MGEQIKNNTPKESHHTMKEGIDTSFSVSTGDLHNAINFSISSVWKEEKEAKNKTVRINVSLTRL